MIWFVVALLVVVAVLLVHSARLAAWKESHPYTASDLGEADRAARKDNSRRSGPIRAGQIVEQLIWLMPNFAPAYNPKDAHFLGQPIDFVVFDGLDEGRDEIEVVFLEVKTGTALLTEREQKVRDAIDSGRVRWGEVLRLPGLKETPVVDWSGISVTFVDPGDAEGIEWDEDNED